MSVATALGMFARQCSGAVLAGGANTRFGGSPKGLTIVGGRRVVDRVLEALRAAADERFIITNDPAVASAVVGVPVHADVRGERASLAGVHSALTYCREAALVVAWDMPFVSAALLARLRQLGEDAGAAAIPTGPRGPEPLCAYYPRSLLDQVERQLARGEARLSAFVAALSAAVILPPNEVAAFGPPERLFANINSAADLAAARQLDLAALSGGDPPLATSSEHR